MGKNPAFQFYVKDWLSDPQLRRSCPSTRGIWIDVLSYMWWNGREGRLICTPIELGRMTGSDSEEIEKFFKDAELYQFCNVTPCNVNVTNCNNEVTIINRRMERESKAKQDTASRVRRYRENKQSNKKVTPPSPTPSPTPLQYTSDFAVFWKAYPKRIGKGGAWGAWKKVNSIKSILNEILKNLEKQKKSEQWRKDNGQFIPNPQTWINQRRWEDEIPDNESRGPDYKEAKEVIDPPEGMTLSEWKAAQE